MLSILIPVYNYDVRKLVQDLYQQAVLLTISWEIILLDDASDPFWQNINQELGQLRHVAYQALPQNIGRASIRNALARKAQYPYLLFMDCDSGVKNAGFLKNYMVQCDPQTVLCGGRSYLPRPPKLPYLLHWHYGRQREVRSVAHRNQSPYTGFMTNNFLVPREVFLAIGMDESIKQYGHEDTLFGLALQQSGIPIVHINNPLLHIGLDPAEEWLLKQRQAVRNLYYLHLQHPQLQTRALVTWQRFHRFGMMRLWYKWLQKQAPQWEAQLQDNPSASLHLLDALKLLWLEEAHRAKYRPFNELNN